jgi:hypothetical protein
LTDFGFLLQKRPIDFGNKLSKTVQSGEWALYAPRNRFTVHLNNKFAIRVFKSQFSCRDHQIQKSRTLNQDFDFILKTNIVKRKLGFSEK